MQMTSELNHVKSIFHHISVIQFWVLFNLICPFSFLRLLFLFLPSFSVRFFDFPTLFFLFLSCSSRSSKVKRQPSDYRLLEKEPGRGIDSFDHLIPLAFLSKIPDKQQEKEMKDARQKKKKTRTKASWCWNSLMHLVLEILMRSNFAACLYYLVLIRRKQCKAIGPKKKTITYIFAPGVNNWFWRRLISNHI